MKTKHRKAAHTKRKYQADALSIYRVMSRIQPFTPDEVLRLSMPIRLSFESLRNGTGTHSDYKDLAIAINTSLIRAMEIDPIAEEMVKRAVEAMTRCAERFQRTGKYGFDGPAIGDIAEAVDFHDQLLQLSTPQQMVGAMRQYVKINNGRLKAGEIGV
jgi:hypothetical protein